jgi:hypothetical protein
MCSARAAGLPLHARDALGQITLKWLLSARGRYLFVWSVAQFVKRRFASAWRERRADVASAAARSGQAARSGPTARCGYATRSVATRVRAGGYVAERCGHFLVAENARRRRLGRCRLTTLTTRLPLSRRSNLRSRRRCRQKQCSNQREFLHMATFARSVLILTLHRRRPQFSNGKAPESSGMVPLAPSIFACAKIRRLTFRKKAGDAYLIL